MPFVSNRGQRIHYTLEGEGPLVVLQHGYLSSAADWRTCGYVDVLTGAGFQVAAVDSLAHGQSDKPTDPALYALAHRAADVVAVIDDLGVERAHGHACFSVPGDHLSAFYLHGRDAAAHMAAFFAAAG
jgi:pimeloyl-ACP methyl ester carboxylesterase